MLDLLALVIILSFCCFRITWLWKFDTICEPLRQYLWSWFPPPPAAEELVNKPRNKKIDWAPAVIDGRSGFIGLRATWIGTLTSCPWCSSFYIVGFFIFLMKFSHVMPDLPLTMWFITWMASWGMCMFIYNHVDQ